MERTSQLLSALSQNVGIVVSPSLAHDRLQHIEFVNLSDKRILVVMVSDAEYRAQQNYPSGRKLFRSEDLERTARYLNVEFAGKVSGGHSRGNSALDARRKSAFR